ncbi:MAG: hypothetical protein GF329_18465 [Candidatus Lokiarchaeota archaeon]|nr:hypothetical protein [Candidatus Lokiarchaeota archaeon]
MVIYELGLTKSGVPLISKQYYEEHNMAVDPVLRSGFLSALNSFAEQAFSDEIESFTMKNFRIVLLTYNKDELSVTSYCIGDKNLNLKVTKKALTKILDKFINKFGIKKLPKDLSKFDNFLPVFDEILGDFAKKPEDRLKSIFG